MGREHGRIPELDGLRVLMIFVVSWFHIWQQSWLEPVIRIPALGIRRYSLDWLVRSGYVWVDGTVLLSVFLLYLPWAKARRENRPNPNARDFYYRRARRVIPGYYFILLLHLFVIALPWKQYASMPFMVKDLVTHLTFTFTHYTDTYHMSNLGGGAWTLAVLVQGYVLFPLIAGGVRKRPVITLSAMALICFAFRAWCVWGLSDYRMVVNHLLNFLDVYVIGILSAEAYLTIREWWDKRQEEPKGRRYLREAGATILFFACLYGLSQMLKVQAGSRNLQETQMIYRPVFALGFAGLILSAPFMLMPFRKILGNPVTKFLGAISMNYYLVHQTIAVHLKRLHIPASVSELPNQVGEQPWQDQYTWLSFGISVGVAVLVTYLVEKPGGKLFDLVRKKIRKEA